MSPDEDSPGTPGEPSGPRVGPARLFLAFAQLTLHSFGGVLFWMRRLFVERWRWFSEQEFVELVAIAQILPGVNGINIAVLIGHRFAGWLGAVASVAGFLTPPCLVVVALGLLHQRYGALPLVQDALAGMSSAAVGLLIATAANMATVLGRRREPWLFVAVAFVAVGVLRWPLLAVVAVLAPLGIFAAWKGRH